MTTLFRSKPVQPLATLVFFLGCMISMHAMSTLTTYDWPTEAGEATLSDKYRVFLAEGNNPLDEVQVLMSHVMFKGDWKRNELEGRTFSFVHMASDATSPITIKVQKLFGEAASEIEVTPRHYAITSEVSNNGEFTEFTINKTNQFISINFLIPSNRTPQYQWVKHMMVIFIDSPETQVPDMNAENTVIYSPSISEYALNNADLIYFPPGFHNLQEYQNPGNKISEDGILLIDEAQDVYIAGGSFVEGALHSRELLGNNRVNNTTLYGRGILSGRNYPRNGDTKCTEQIISDLIHLGKNATIHGITYMESPCHGIVTQQNANIHNIKFLGWHANNDGIRVGSHSEIYNSFLRAVDDHFYNFKIHVHDVVLWAGHNGGILTYGWGGLANDNTYNSGASVIENIDIIHPEWTGLGNNNGLIMSQTGLDYQPHDYNTNTTTTTLRNIRVDGLIPGITNLKPRSKTESGVSINIAVKIPEDRLGYLGDLVLENIRVDGLIDNHRGLIRGLENAASDTDNIPYLIKNITLKNIMIGNECVNTANQSAYFNIDANTTENITFSGVCNDTDISENPVAPTQPEAPEAPEVPEVPEVPETPNEPTPIESPTKPTTENTGNEPARKNNEKSGGGSTPFAGLLFLYLFMRLKKNKW